MRFELVAASSTRTPETLYVSGFLVRSPAQLPYRYESRQTCALRQRRDVIQTAQDCCRPWEATDECTPDVIPATGLKPGPHFPELRKQDGAECLT